MTKHVNKVELIGIVKSLVFKEYNSGKSLTTMNILTIYKEYNSSHRVTAWDELAKDCDMLLQEGDTVSIEGRLQNSSYKDKEGNTKWITQVVAYKVENLSGRDEEPVDVPESTISDEDVPF